MDQNMNPTPKELETLRFIVNYRAQYGYPPSVPDIAKAGSISPTVARLRVKALVGKGYLSAVRYRARSLVVLKDEAGVPVTP